MTFGASNRLKERGERSVRGLGGEVIHSSSIVAGNLLNFVVIL